MMMHDVLKRERCYIVAIKIYKKTFLSMINRNDLEIENGDARGRGMVEGFPNMHYVCH